MRDLLAMILGGGKGTRLFPLTRYRSKPAVPLAGKYRLVDIPISNCLNSGLNQIYLLTQFNSVSLHRHIRQSYSFDRFGGGFVEILAAQQTFDSGEEWYQGTADAVRKNLRFLEQPGIRHVLILSGDQLYRMDYRQLLESHCRAGAEVTIAAVPVPASKTVAFGIVACDAAGQVLRFREKPAHQEELHDVRTNPAWLEARGVAAKGREYLANMGIYLFDRDVLVRLLKDTQFQDFGKEVFPYCLRSHKVQTHLFDDYWEDLGTIKAYYDANLALARRVPPIRLVSEGWPIYTEARHLAPSEIAGASITDSMVVDGCVIGEDVVINNSVIGLRCRIGDNVTIKQSILIGTDVDQSDVDVVQDLANRRPPIGIGDGCKIERTIIDKGCRIGKNVQIHPYEGMIPTIDIPDLTIRNGILVLPTGSVVPDGCIIGALDRDSR